VPKENALVSVIFKEQNKNQIYKPKELAFNNKKQVKECSIHRMTHDLITTVIYQPNSRKCGD
jgi:hypothetical protein